MHFKNVTNPHSVFFDGSFDMNKFSQKNGAAIQFQKKLIIAQLMDLNKHVFLLPDTFPSWVALVNKEDHPSVKEMRMIDKAIGMVVQVFQKSKQESSENLEDGDALVDFEPNPQTLLNSKNSDMSECIFFARAVTAFKSFKQTMNISEDDVIEKIFEKLDDHSDQSNLSQTVVEAAKQIVQLDLESTMSELSQV